MPDRPESFSSYSFLVVLKDAQGGETPVGGFATASGLPRKLQGLHKVGDVTLKRGIVNASALQAWIGSARSGGAAIRKEVLLIQRDGSGTDGSGREVGIWQLSGSYPVKFDGPTLGGKGTDVAIEELVLSPERIEWIPPK